MPVYGVHTRSCSNACVECFAGVPAKSFNSCGFDDLKVHVFEPVTHLAQRGSESEGENREISLIESGKEMILRVE